MGMGYIGLPTAGILAASGYNVYGYDISTKVVEAINEGNITFHEPGLKALAGAAINSGNLKAYSDLQPADVFIIAVPTPVNQNNKADLSAIEFCAEKIVNVLKPGNLIILESTSPPGTTKDLVVPALEKTNLKAGKDFFVAYCPERVMPGKILNEITQTSRVIGGINEASANKARELYKTFVDAEIYLTDSLTAEMVKLVENTYRDVNIALANELAKIAHHSSFNVHEVIELANLHPRVHLHQPGPGVGGHCIPVDPWFIVEKFPVTSKLIKQARQINDSMPCFIYKLVKKHLKEVGLDRAKITIMGISYKANVDDARNSPVLKLIENIEKDPDLFLSVYDPFTSSLDCELLGFEESLKDSDCIIIAVDHKEFKFLNPAEIAKLVKTPLIIDTRNFLDRKLWEENGFRFIFFGHGRSIYKSERNQNG